MSAPLDRAHLAMLASVVGRATEQMEEFEAAGALDTIETWFWASLCDNYLELTKGRAYAGDASALATWSASLSTALRLFAPFVPYIAEEVWSWYDGSGSSVHEAPWPTATELGAATGDPAVLEAAVAVLAQIRRYKTESRMSMRHPLQSITVTGPAPWLEKLTPALDDVRSAGAVGKAELRPSDSGDVSIHFGAAGT